MKTRKIPFPARWILAASLGLGCGGVGVAQDQVTWVRDPTLGEPAGRTGLRVPCGNYGVFHFDIPGYPGAPPPPPIVLPNPGTLCVPYQAGCESGQEIPPYYPSFGPGGVVALPAEPPISIPGDGSSSKRGEGLPAKSAWGPCLNGSCFAAKHVASGVRPWVAVIDWDDPHGWSIGWTLREVLGPNPGPDPQHDYDLALLPFFTPALQAFSGKGVTDVHVLAKLCEISEAVDRGGVRPPYAINMSFGRYFRAGQDWDQGATCKSDALSCQIARVLEHLYRPPSGPAPATVLVAAAGNYRAVQFPAVVQTVIPVGGLDLDGFLALRTTSPTWETAPELAGLVRSRGLLPASGLCLEATLGQDGSASWAAPPGTSYSSALLSGWLTLELTDKTVSDPLLPALWQLARSCPATGRCTYRLQQGNQSSFGPHGTTDLLFGRLFEAARHDCGQPPAQGVATVIATVPPTLVPNPTVSVPSFLEALSGWELPSPGSNPCIPCAGLNGPPPKRLGRDATKALYGVVGAVPLDWTIDFSENGSFVEGTLVDAIYLRSGNDFRKVSLSSNDLSLVQAGKLNGLYLSGAGAYVSASHQASLIFVQHRTGDGTNADKPFWSSVPVYFP